MSINQNTPDELAQQALATGGLVDPLTAADVLPKDPRQIDMPEVEEGVEVAMSPLRKSTARLLSPKDDIFNKAQTQIEQLQSGDTLTPEAVEPDPDAATDANTLGIQETEVEPAAPVIPQTGTQLMTDIVEEGYQQLPPGLGNLVSDVDEYADFDEASAAAYAAFSRGSVIKPDGSEVATVLGELQTARINNLVVRGQQKVAGQDGLLTDFRATGASGDAKIPDEGTIYASIEAISKTYSTQIAENKREEITLEATRQMADLLGVSEGRLTKTILGRQKGGVIIEEGAGLAETMLASRDLLISELQKLDGLAKAAATGGDTDALQFRAQLELVAQLQNQIKGAQTEIARALSSFRIPARSGDAAGEMSKTDLTGLLEDYGGTQDIRDMAAAYLQQGDNIVAKAQIAKAGSKFKRFSDGFYEAWINILLSNPVTHTKNIVGAFLTTFAHVPETLVAGAIGTTRRAMGGEGGVYLGQANAQMFGMMMSMREAFGAAGKSFVTGESVMPGSKIEGAEGRRHINQFSSEGMAAGPMATMVDVLGHTMTLGRVPTRALQFEDTLFKVVAHRMSLYENAYGTGMAQGLRGDDLSTHIAEFIHNPPADYLKQADAHAKYVTLQNELDPAGKAIADIRNKVPLIRYFAPFIKTPYNAFKYAFVDRGPIGVFYGESRRSIQRSRLPGATQADKAAGDMAMARLIMGNGTAMSMAMLVAEGHITGGGPADDGQRANLRAQGWQPYSIRIPGTNEYVSYMGLEPFASTFMLGADASEIMMNGSMSDADTDQIIAGVAAAFAHQLTDKTFMSGFNNLISTLNDPTRYANSTAKSLVASLVPRVASQIEKVGIPGLIEADPVMRATRTYIDEIKAQIPGWSRTLPPRRNVYGQAVVLNGALGPDIISPLYSSTRGPNPMDPDKKYAERVFAITKELEEIKWGPSMHGRMAMTNQLGGLIEGVEMTPQEEDLYHQYAGMFTLRAFEKTIKKPEYRKLKKQAIVPKGELRTPANDLALQRAQFMLRTALAHPQKGARKQAMDRLMNHPEVGRELRRRTNQLKRDTNQLNRAAR